MTKQHQTTQDTVLLPEHPSRDLSSRDFVNLEYSAGAGEKQRVKIPKGLVARFGGWMLGSHASCNTVLMADGVNGMHAQIDYVENSVARLTHLTTGRKDSMRVAGKWLPVGESCECPLPVVFQVGIVKCVLSD